MRLGYALVGAVWSAGLGLAGCRGSGAVGPTIEPPPTPHDEPSEVSDAELETEPSPAATRPAGPPARQTFVLAPTPFDATMLVVEPVQDVSPVVLFPDELAKVRRELARALADRGHAVVPVDELERIEVAAAQGRLVLEDDRRCRSPLRPDEVVARYFTEHYLARTEAGCYPPCQLQISIDHGNVIQDPMLISSPVRRGHEPEAWARAASRIHEGPPSLAGLGAFGSNRPPPIMFGPPGAIGPWRKEPTGERLSALEPEVATCAHPDPRVGFSYDVKAAVRADGSIARCHASADHWMARAADRDCLCTGVETLRLSAGSAGRRFRVVARDEGGFISKQRFARLQPGTEPWVQRLNESTVLVTCTEEQPLEAPLDVTVVLGLAPDGNVDQVEVFGELSTMSSMHFARCLVRELSAVPLPCRPPGIDQLQVGLQLEAAGH